MSAISEGQRHGISNETAGSRQVWARVAGLMYWLVLLVDLTGLQLRSPTGTYLMLAGTLLTVPLALGLYYTVRPAGQTLARTALCFRLIEVVIGLLSILAGLAVIDAKPVLAFAHWNDATSFGAFVFTIGSTIFFYLFLKSRYIPRALSWLGLAASLIAMAACLIHFARPSFPAMTIYQWLPLLLAEPSTGLWLLVKPLRHGRIDIPE